MEQKTELDMLTAIYHHVKDNGVMDQKAPGSLGGIWTDDTYRIGAFNMYARLCDDGHTYEIGFSNFKAWSSYGRDVEYGTGCSIVQLIELHALLFEIPSEPSLDDAIDDRPLYLWL